MRNHRIIIGNVDKYRGLLSPMMLQSFKLNNSTRYLFTIFAWISTPW